MVLVSVALNIEANTVDHPCFGNIWLGKFKYLKNETPLNFPLCPEQFPFDVDLFTGQTFFELNFCFIFPMFI
eukprot:UN12402